MVARLTFKRFFVDNFKTIVEAVSTCLEKFTTRGFKISLRANFGHFDKKFLAKRSVKIGTV